MQTKLLDALLSTVFRTLINADWKQVVSDIVSGVALDYVGTGVLAGLGDSRLNSGRIILRFVWSDQFCALLCSI